VDGQQQVAQVGLVSEGERRDLGQPVVAQVESRQLSQSGERSVDRRQSIMRQVDVQQHLSSAEHVRTNLQQQQQRTARLFKTFHTTLLHH